MSFPVVKVWSLWLCPIDVFSDNFSGVEFLAADMAKCQATKPEQHTSSLQVTGW